MFFTDMNIPKPFEPKKLPFNTDAIICSPKIVQLMSDASFLFGEYKGLLSNTPNPMLLMSPLLSQEAVLSSKLEGTHATLEDLLNYDAGIGVNISNDEMTEIKNYRKALFYALKHLSIMGDESSTEEKKLPLSSRIIRIMHKILLNNARGSTKRPGEFKVNQNYIGSRGSVSYTPVSPMLTGEYMSNLEEYIHYQDVNGLIQAGILHAQFEMIHPFEDGNGRIGRLLIPLFFYYNGMLPLPTFYMSSYFNNDRALYIQNLSKISTDNAWEGWIEYFLEGIIEQSKVNTCKAIEILNLYNTSKEKVLTLPSKHAIEVLDFLFNVPIVRTKTVEDGIKSITKATAYNILNQMVEKDILIKSGPTRNKTYLFKELVDIIMY